MGGDGDPAESGQRSIRQQNIIYQRRTRLTYSPSGQVTVQSPAGDNVTNLENQFLAIASYKAT